MTPARTLWWIRAAHTAIWFAFAITIVALPFVAAFGDFLLGVALIAFIAIEIVALAANRMQCPLRDAAARYTDDRTDGFDIFLPGWLAANTKLIFTPILVLGVFMLGWRWLTG